MYDLTNVAPRDTTKTATKIDRTRENDDDHEDDEDDHDEGTMSRRRRRRGCVCVLLFNLRVWFSFSCVLNTYKSIPKLYHKTNARTDIERRLSKEREREREREDREEI
jgi:hypothetical protein